MTPEVLQYLMDTLKIYFHYNQQFEICEKDNHKTMIFPYH